MEIERIMGKNNQQGGFENRQMQMSQQWERIGAGGIFQIPTLVTLQLNPVKLNRTENARKPSLLAKRGNKSDTQDEEQLLVQDIVKNTRGILNKLTPENFDKLLEKFLSLKLEDKDERIGAVISVVFKKAIDVPSFSAAYAKMVHEKSQEGSKIFRKKILDQCQKEFQRENTDEEALKVLATKLAEAAEDAKDGIKAEMEEKKIIARRRSLGNIGFIGELYKLEMLTPKFMVECVNMLLSNRNEESLECLCKLLTTVGQKLDQISDIKGGKWVPEPKFMENTFTKLKQLSSDNDLSSRIRFALLDVYELRDSGWKPRREPNVPKTIDEVQRGTIRAKQFQKKQKGDWTVVSSNKSSRFAADTKRQGASDSSGDLSKFAPADGVWERGCGFPTKNNLTPRFSRLNYRKSEAEEEMISMRTKFKLDFDHVVQNHYVQITLLKEQTQILETEIQSQTTTVRKLESENTTLLRQNENLRQQVTHMDLELTEKDTTINTSLARARAEVREQLDKLTKEEAANKQLRSQNLELLEQVATLTLTQNRDRHERTSEMDHWKNQVESREEELNRFKEEDMRRAGVLYEAFSTYMRSTSAATGQPLPSSYYTNPDNKSNTKSVPTGSAIGNMSSIGGAGDNEKKKS